MLKIYKTENSNLIEKQYFHKKSWINIVNPTKDELDIIIKKFRIPVDFILDALDMDERSRVDIENKKLFIVLRVPIEEKDSSKQNFNTTSFGVLLFKDYIITINKNQDFNIVDNLLNKKLRNTSLNTQNNIIFLLKIFRKVSLLYLKYLREVRRQTEVIENSFSKNVSNKVLADLLKLEKSLLYFKTGLKLNEIVFNKFKRLAAISENEIHRDFLDDIIIENTQAAETTSIYNKVIDDMKNYFFSIISNNLNNRMKNLTMITVALMLPTLFTSFYGMNLKLPFQDNSYLSIVVLILSFVASFVTLFFLSNKK